MEIILSLIVGLVVGVLACFFFWRYLLLLKPQIEISPRIAKAPSITVPGKYAYCFKVINKGKRQAINVRIGAAVCELRPVPGGEIASTIFRLPFKCSQIEALGPKENIGKHWGISPIFVFRSIPDIEIEDLLQQGERERKLLVTLTATDSVSGTTIVKRVSYTASDIKVGEFVYGFTWKIESSPGS